SSPLVRSSPPLPSPGIARDRALPNGSGSTWHGGTGPRTSCRSTTVRLRCATTAEAKSASYGTLDIRLRGPAAPGFCEHNLDGFPRYIWCHEVKYHLTRFASPSS